MNPIKKFFKAVYYIVCSFYLVFYEIYVELRDWNVQEDIDEVKELIQYQKELKSKKKRRRKQHERAT